MSAEPVTSQQPTMAVPKKGYVRWIVCTLLLFATTINYIDRQVLGILAPTLQKEIGWSEVQYGYIVTAFQAAYAIGLLVVGRVLDVVGTKLGFAVAIVFWSLAAMAHALVRTPFGFGFARFGLGLGEAGNFPAAIKTVAEWFPKRERALATGIFNGGSNLGAIIAPAIVPIIALTWSWQAAFVITGAIGFIWLFFWLWLYNPPEKHKSVTPGELLYIRSDAEEAVTPIPWGRIIGKRQAWAFAIGKFLTDPVWWFYLYWLGKFLNEKHGVTLSKIGPPLIVIYVIADIGSIGGGWLSSRFIRNGWSVNKARKVAMLICALCVVPVVFAPLVSGLWTAVVLIGLAAAAHQGWSANIFTTASDMFPKRAVGSVVGFGGMAGSIGGMLVATGTGWILQLTGSYNLVFAICAAAYLVALAIIHMMVPRLEPADV
ncbi:MAG TPA: MFS transporter [Thermoanaerobaculia bacterium]|nr:MFS transporter [Thermoanaerobaculia bacterium]